MKKDYTAFQIVQLGCSNIVPIQHKDLLKSGKLQSSFYKSNSS